MRMGIILGIIFSSIGLIFIKLAKSNGLMNPALVGLALFGYSYFIDDVWIILAIGVTLTVLGIFSLQSNN